MADEPVNQSDLPDVDSDDPKISESSLRGIPDTKKKKEKEEPEHQAELDEVFKLHDKICSKVESAVSSLQEILPMIEQLYKKISEGDLSNYRLDRRLRIAPLVQNIVAAHSHLGKSARSARAIVAIQKDEIEEIHFSPFE